MSLQYYSFMKPFFLSLSLSSLTHLYQKKWKHQWHLLTCPRYLCLTGSVWRCRRLTPQCWQYCLKLPLPYVHWAHCGMRPECLGSQCGCSHINAKNSWEVVEGECDEGKRFKRRKWPYVFNGTISRALSMWAARCGCHVETVFVLLFFVCVFIFWTGHQATGRSSSLLLRKKLLCFLHKLGQPLNHISYISAIIQYLPPIDGIQILLFSVVVLWRFCNVLKF